MTSLLSSISGQFTKALILSTFLPVVLFTIAFLWLVHPTLPAGLPVPEEIKNLDKEWHIALLTLVVITVAGILHNLYLSIISLYEGYPWAETWFGWLGKWMVERRWTVMRSHRDRMRNIRKELKPLASTVPGVAQLREDMSSPQSGLTLALNDGYPYEQDLLLPTGLGNVIRNFEEYPRQRYGTSAVPLWPRLIAKIDSAYATQIDEARLAFQFTLNSSLLAAIAALLTLWFGIATAEPLWPGSKPFLWKALFFGVVSWLFYRASIPRAGVWGAHVKAAFDLYRLQLLEQLGYKDHKPTTLATEQEIWKALAIEYSFPDTKREPQPYAPVPQAAPVTSVTVRGAVTTINWARGVSSPPVPTPPYPTIDVTFHISNSGAAAAPSLIITDIVPPQWSFVHGSLSAGTVSMDGPSVLKIELSSLAAGTACMVTYKLCSLVP